MKNHFDFKDLMTFGLFLLAVLFITLLTIRVYIL